MLDTNGAGYTKLVSSFTTVADAVRRYNAVDDKYTPAEMAAAIDELEHYTAFIGNHVTPFGRWDQPDFWPDWDVFDKNCAEDHGYMLVENVKPLGLSNGGSIIDPNFKAMFTDDGSYEVELLGYVDGEWSSLNTITVNRGNGAKLALTTSLPRWLVVHVYQSAATGHLEYFGLVANTSSTTNKTLTNLNPDETCTYFSGSSVSYMSILARVANMPFASDLSSANSGVSANHHIEYDHVINVARAVASLTTYRMYYSCWKLQKVLWENCDTVTNKTTSIAEMFNGCYMLSDITVPTLGGTNTTTCLSMFNSCMSLPAFSIEGWNIPKCTTAATMFANCYNLQVLYADNVTMTACTTLLSMFSGCRSLRFVYMNNLYAPNLTTIATMFQTCGNLEEVQLATSGSYGNGLKVTTFDGMFKSDCSLRKFDLSGWKFASGVVTAGASMLSNCYSLVDPVWPTQIYANNGSTVIVPELTALDNLSVNSLVDYINHLYSSYAVTVKIGGGNKMKLEEFYPSAITTATNRNITLS